ncbi:Alkaline-phosphatase-like family protein [Thalictrum thalictroides]|uniref:Alkaline-phosphatase-like family protein n=1 Tax=Thalictrum thalictroides TaxID=46969 RepID=A0A7J6VQA8_THATH|nr:Alkaline-phosphatase-like family protein [Thalictrum thalictroides]
MLQMVMSDHGMTDSGNHGGSSYEETDSLALFIGLGSKAPDYASATCNAVFQVDIAPTLSGVFENAISVLLTVQAMRQMVDKWQTKSNIGKRVANQNSFFVFAGV